MALGSKAPKSLKQAFEDPPPYNVMRSSIHFDLVCFSVGCVDRFCFCVLIDLYFKAPQDIIGRGGQGHAITTAAGSSRGMQLCRTANN